MLVKIGLLENTYCKQDVVKLIKYLYPFVQTFIQRYYKTPIPKCFGMLYGLTEISNPFYMLENCVLAIKSKYIYLYILSKNEKIIKIRYCGSFSHHIFRFTKNNDICYYIDSFEYECPILYPTRLSIIKQPPINFHQIIKKNINI